MRGDVRYVRIGELLEMTLPPMGFELVDLETSPKGRLVRVFIDKPAGERGRGSERRGLRARQQPPHAPVHRREHRLRPARGVVAGPRPAAAKLADYARFAGEEAQINLHEPADGARRWKGILRGVDGRQRPPRDRDRHADDPVRRRSTVAAWYRRSSGEKRNEPRTAAPGGCPRAREERAEGNRLRRARVGARVGDQEALPEPGNRRARVDRPRDRRLRLVPPLDRRARRGARGARAPDRDHRRRWSATPSSSWATSSRSRSSRSSSAASARRRRSR